MHEYEAGIIQTENRGNFTYIVTLSCETIAREVVAGQFVQVRVGTGTDPFLRRTFSVFGVDRSRGLVKLMIDAIGPGTELLAGTKHGCSLSVIGPLGNGFDLTDISSCLLVAGGVGIAPLLFLSESLKTKIAGPVEFMVGTQTAGVHEAYDGLYGDNLTVLRATDDGSLGYKGFVTVLLEARLGTMKPDCIYTCGPHQMMKAVAAIAEKHGIRCQVSLEERMACGVGACYGCTVQLQDGSMVRTCVDGPVFDAHEVTW
ncbi:dihydroorotate dehydrogenase electron transfer subunit [Candidatus Latescibacterota bacterium]